MRNLIGILILGLAFGAQAQTTEKSPWAHESEASIVQVSGNTKSESYSAKQLTSYKFDLNTLSLKARYLSTKTSGTETARAWDASLRFERDLSDKWAAFIQHGAEADAFGGYVQRDNTDIGVKYFFIKSDTELLFSELGARSSKVNLGGGTTDTTSGGRFYTEYNRKINDSTSGKFWVEYIHNTKDSDAYLLNYEPSLSVMLSQVFSVKLAYLVKYHNKTATATEDKNDTTFTTSLVAKF